MLGIQNLDGQSRLDLILFVLAALSLLCVPLNKCGYYIQVAIFLCLMIITAITFSLIVGVGLMDSGMLAYPIFILFSAFFFNTSAAFISAALSITSVFLVLYLEQRGALSMAEWDSQTQAIIMSIMLAATGMIVYLIVIENHYNHTNVLGKRFELIFTDTTAIPWSSQV